jgi:uncharacterized integral membrane protein
MLFVYVLMALIGVAATLFVIQNPDPVAVSFLHWRTAGMPLSLVILLSAFVGVVFASVTGFAQQIRLKLRIRRLEQRIAQLSTAEAQRAEAQRAEAQRVEAQRAAAPPPRPDAAPR